MGWHRSRRSRSRSRSRSFSPVRRKRYDDPRDHGRSSRPSYRDRRSPAPSGLLVRNISLDARPEDLRIPFERFGPLKDVYIPKNYYTGEARGFGFVKFRDAEDAAEAKEQLHRAVIGGREIRIVFAEENRKTPQEMRRMSHISHGSYRQRSPSRSPRQRNRCYSRSPNSPRHDASRGSHRQRSPSRSPRQWNGAYSRSHNSPRHDTRGPRSRGDYHSPRQARSISSDERDYVQNHKSSRHSRSASLSPRGRQDYRFDPRSSSLKESVRSPYDEKHARTRSQSPRN